MRSRATARVAAAAALAVAGLTTLPARAGLICIQRGQQWADRNGWWHVPPPPFQTGPKAATQLAAEPWGDVIGAYPPDGQVGLWAGNGKELWQSTDGGCDWARRAYVGANGIAPGLPPRPALPGDDASILGVRVGFDGVPTSRAVGRDRYVYLYGVDVTAGADPAPFIGVERAEAGGSGTFVSTSVLAAAATYPVDLAVSEDAARCVWLLTASRPTSGVDVTYELLRSTDAASSWTVVSRSTPVRRLLAPPTGTSCDVVWGTTGTALARSNDGGATFHDVASTTGDAAPAFAPYFAVDPKTGLVPRGADLLLPGRDGVLHRVDPATGAVTGGTTLPGTAAAVTALDAGARGRFVVATGDGVFELDQRRPHAVWTDLSPAGATPTVLATVRNGVWGYPGAYLVAGLTTSEIVLRQWPRPDAPGGSDPATSPAALRSRSYREWLPDFDLRTPPAHATTLTPAATELTLAPGQTATVPYDFGVPARRTPVDIDFEIDTTSSMSSAINGLRTGIAAMVNSFDAALLDVQVGLGDIKDFGALALAHDKDDTYGYLRRVKVAPPGQRLADQLSALYQSRGGEYPEAQTVGVTQAITGTGLVGTGEAGSAAYVPPDQDAEFRPSAGKLMVVITDAPANEGGVYPTVTQAGAVARKAGVVVLGLAVQGAKYSPRPHLEALAQESGGLTPAGGVDCENDGQLDLKPGDPLVCDVAPGAQYVAPVGVSATALVLAARPRTAATFALRGDTSAVRAASGAVTTLLDRATDRTLRYDVTYGCDAADAGQDKVVDVDALLAGAAVATSRTTIHCTALGALPGVSPKVGAPAGTDVTQAVYQAPLAPVAQPNPNVQVNSQVSSQSATQPLSGLVTEDEYVPQLSLAREDARDVQPGPLFLMSALLTAAAAGAVMLRVQRQAQLAKARR